MDNITGTVGGRLGVVGVIGKFRMAVLLYVCVLSMWVFYDSALSFRYVRDNFIAGRRCTDRN